MTEPDEVQQDKHVLWTIKVTAECLAPGFGGRPMKRFERATYIVDGEATLSEMMQWVERTERTKYDALGWHVLNLVSEYTIEL